MRVSLDLKCSFQARHIVVVAPLSIGLQLFEEEGFVLTATIRPLEAVTEPHFYASVYYVGIDHVHSIGQLSYSIRTVRFPARVERNRAERCAIKPNSMTIQAPLSTYLTKYRHRSAGKCLVRITLKTFIWNKCFR